MHNPVPSEPYSLAKFNCTKVIWMGALHDAVLAGNLNRLRRLLQGLQGPGTAATGGNSDGSGGSSSGSSSSAGSRSGRRDGVNAKARVHDTESTALHLAAQSGHQDMVRWGCLSL